MGRTEHEWIEQRSRFSAPTSSNTRSNTTLRLQWKQPSPCERNYSSRKENRQVAAITDVVIGSYDVAIEIIGRDPEKWQPRTRETADHSFPYCVAVSLRDGAVTRRSFDKKRFADSALASLMQKIRVVQQPEFMGRYPQAMPTRVTVRTRSDKEYVKQVVIRLVVLAIRCPTTKWRRNSSDLQQDNRITHGQTGDRPGMAIRPG